MDSQVRDLYLNYLTAKRLLRALVDAIPEDLRNEPERDAKRFLNHVDKIEYHFEVESANTASQAV